MDASASICSLPPRSAAPPGPPPDRSSLAASVSSVARAPTAPAPCTTMASRSSSALRSTWSSVLLGGGPSFRSRMLCTVSGLLLASAYGVALGAREGGSSLLVHAVGVPAVLVAVACLGLPALFVVLSLCGVPLRVEGILDASTSAIAATGLGLAGIAPLTVLYAVTVGTAGSAAFVSAVGLLGVGSLGLSRLNRAIRAAFGDADSGVRIVAGFVQLVFSFFCVVLGWRLWLDVLPVLGGGS